MAVVASLPITLAVVLAGCATAPAQPDAGGLESSAPVSSVSSAGVWGVQDGSLTSARGIACGPQPSGNNAGLARMLADTNNPPPMGPPTTPPTPPSPAPSPPPVPGQFEWTDLTLVPPPTATKPVACVDVALDALRTMPEGVGSAQPAKVWLASLSAPTPARIEADGSFSPFFTDVLAWVFYFDDLPPMCPAGGPAASGSAEPIQCDPASMGPSSAILSVDATTAEPLTNEYGGGPLLP